MENPIVNLKKWAAKTASLVERICLAKKGMPIGLALLFFDPTAPEDEQFNFVIQLAADPNEPTDIACFEYIMRGVKEIYEEGIPEEDSAPVRGKFH
jgi:hypothetical protein